MSERQHPERQPSPQRQQTEDEIKQRYRRLTLLRRGTGLFCLFLGGLSGYLDTKVAIEGDVDIPATFITAPTALGLTISSVLAKRTTQRGVERLINDYAEQMDVNPRESRFFRTEMYGKPDGSFVMESSADASILDGLRYDDVHRSILRLSGATRDGCAYAGGLAMNGFTGDFLVSSPAISPQAVGLIGAGAAGLNVVMQIIEDGSTRAHIRGYSAQLDNIDATSGFGPNPNMPPPPKA